MQHQLASNVSVTFGYYRRSFANFLAEDNQFVTPADYSSYCVTAPVDSRLPNGGGNQICGYQDVNPAFFGRVQNVVQDASHYGKQTQIYDGFDLTENIRFPGGATISGGLNWGRTKTSACFAIDSPAGPGPTQLAGVSFPVDFCAVEPPMLPTATFSGFYTWPLGIVTSATFRDFPGPMLTATCNVGNAQVAPSHGRNLSSGPNGNVNVALIKPGTMYLPHNRQFDVRVSKRFRFGGNRRLLANLDLFNLFNKTGVDVINAQYGVNWQRPILLQMPRFVKIGGQFDF